MKCREQKLRCLTDTSEVSYFGNAMIDVYTASRSISHVYTASRTVVWRRKKEETLKRLQLEGFERLLCDEQTTPFHAIRVHLGNAIDSQKQLVKEYFKCQIELIFQAISGDLKRMGDERAIRNNDKDQDVRERINRKLSNAKEDLGTIVAMLKDNDVDVDSI